MSDEAFLQEIRAHYNAPGTAPAEAMWEEIERRFDRPAASPRGGRGLGFGGGWLRVAAGILLLLAGVGIGRFTAPAPPSVAGAGSPVWAEDGSPEQLLPTFSHLREADLLLAILTEEGGDAQIREQAARWAQSLLVETAILKRLHGESDPEIAALLEELESMLGLVAGLAPGEAGTVGPDPLGSLARTLEAGALRTRIHALLPRKAS